MTDCRGVARWVLTGTWCTKMEVAPIVHVDEPRNRKPIYKTGPHKLLWKARPPPYVAFVHLIMVVVLVVMDLCLLMLNIANLRIKTTHCGQQKDNNVHSKSGCPISSQECCLSITSMKFKCHAR